LSFQLGVGELTGHKGVYLALELPFVGFKAFAAFPPAQ